MKIELRFSKAANLYPATAEIVLNSYFADDLPLLTSECVTMSELEAELRLIERQIANVRAEAKRKFLAAGVSN